MNEILGHSVSCQKKEACECSNSVVIQSQQCHFNVLSTNDE